MSRVFQHHPLARGLTALLLITLIASGLGIILPARAAGTDGPDAQALNDLAAPMVTYYPVPSSAYLTNPGIGWQHGPGNVTQLLPETTVYATREEISWKILNPSQGVYNWTALDNWLNKAKANGQQLSFRVYTMRGESWGGHQVPDWVISKGATIRSSGEPDYTNCVYQAEWATFVEALRARYDGNPDIAFIDISGYGNFNEWSWQETTVFDNNALDPASLDGQARKRLADMFIGGQDSTHQCSSSSGATQTISYSHAGFKTTQLVMPFAGIRQSTEYVVSRRSDVGIRYDCLGKIDSTNFVMGKIGTPISNTWSKAPIIYEMCSVTTEQQYMTETEKLLQASHGSLVHDNLNNPRDPSVLEKVMRLAGYRYQLNSITMATTASVGGSVAYEMHWRNVGYAPSYPRMGQRLVLHAALVNSSGAVVTDQMLNATIANWMPAATLPGTPPDNVVSGALAVPGGLAAGTYSLRVGILDQRTGRPINLAFDGRDATGMYSVGTVQVGSSNVTAVPPTVQPPTATKLPASATPTATATTTPKPSATATTVPAATATTRPGVTAQPNATATATAWPTVTAWPTNTPTVTPWPTVTAWPTNTPTVTPWPTVTSWPTNTPSPTPLPSATPFPTVASWPTAIPSATPWAPTSVANLPTAVPPAGQQPTVPPPANPPQGGSLNHLGDVDGFAQAGDRRWTATVTVLVHNAQEAPVAGVKVSGTWNSGSWGGEEWGVCYTDASGMCSITRSDIRTNRSEITFNLLYAHIDGSTYNSSANHDPDNDWQWGGRREKYVQITIRRP